MLPVRNREQERLREPNELQHNFNIVQQGFKVMQQQIGDAATQIKLGREEFHVLHKELERTDDVTRTQLGEIQLNHHQINKLVHAQHNL